jgi:hypothetical protein
MRSKRSQIGWCDDNIGLKLVKYTQIPGENVAADPLPPRPIQPYCRIWFSVENKGRSPSRMIDLCIEKLPEKRPPPVSLDNRPMVDPQPMQVIRTHKLQTMPTNCAYWKKYQLEVKYVKDNVWRNYMLVMTQWPDLPKVPSPTYNGDHSLAQVRTTP